MTQQRALHVQKMIVMGCVALVAATAGKFVKPMTALLKVTAVTMRAAKITMPAAVLILCLLNASFQ